MAVALMARDLSQSWMEIIKRVRRLPKECLVNDGRDAPPKLSAVNLPQSSMP